MIIATIYSWFLQVHQLLNYKFMLTQLEEWKKKPIFPCTFPEYLFLKQDISYPENMSFALQDLILNGNVELAIDNEKEKFRKI